MQRFLILDDGTVMKGHPFGAQKDAYGEIVFTTSMTGYLESITDPSYRGQILTFASPTISNYSIDKSKFESDKAQVSAVVTKDAHSILYSGKNGYNFDKFLSESGVPGIDGVDTRMLVRKIRERGVMRAWIKDNNEIPKHWADPMFTDLVGEVSCIEPYELKGSNETTYLTIDVGAKKSLLRKMTEIGSLRIVPYNYDFSSIDFEYDAIFISNGPGDPSHAALSGVRDFIAESFGKLPIFGVCLGHQIISLSAGAKTKKMTFGHRGSNHAVTDGTRILITSHNHGYTVDSESLKGTKLKARQWDINDGSIEMVEHEDFPVVSVQYHPEASPGPHDSASFFAKINKIVEDHYATT